MATQRLTVASLAGDSAVVVARRFDSWTNRVDPVALDKFCGYLREHGTSLPVIYYCEWLDRWLMGDLVPGPVSVKGHRYQAACLSREQALAWADKCGQQFPEQEWLATRLREAAAGWGSIAQRIAVIVVREMLGPTTRDEELAASLANVPEWLTPPESNASSGM